MALGGVSQAAIRVAGEQLLAYVVSERSTEELLTDLPQQLPDYLQPTQRLALPPLARLANGKIDRQALPDPADPAAGHAMQAPRDALETLLVDLYAELLERDAVSIEHSLFDLGRHSLMVILLSPPLPKLLQH